MPETTQKPLSWFRINPQIRNDLGSEIDLKNLGESLRVRQLAPVGATPTGELIYGFRRYKAACLAGLRELMVTIYGEPLSEADIKMIQVTENIHRLDMSPFEKWNAYTELRRLNPQWNSKDLADHLKLDPSVVTKWLSPSKCIKAWQDALKTGTVGISDCYVASQASEEEQIKLLALKLGGTSRDDLARRIRRSKPESKEVVKAARISIPLPCGTKIVMSGTKLTLADVVEQLSECLQAARSALRQDWDVKTWQKVMQDVSTTTKGVAADV